MESLTRVTPATLDVLATLVDAQDDMHGFAIVQATGRPGGTIYPILGRLSRLGWISGHWETEHPLEGFPRRRFYQLEPDATRAARTLLAERRALQ